MPLLASGLGAWMKVGVSAAVDLKNCGSNQYIYRRIVRSRGHYVCVVYSIFGGWEDVVDVLRVRGEIGGGSRSW